MLATLVMFISFKERKLFIGFFKKVYLKVTWSRAITIGTIFF